MLGVAGRLDRSAGGSGQWKKCGQEMCSVCGELGWVCAGGRMEGVPAKAVLGVVRGLGAEGAAVSGWGGVQHKMTMGSALLQSAPSWLRASLLTGHTAATERAQGDSRGRRHGTD